MGYGLGGNDLCGRVCCARLSGSDGLSRRPASSLNFVHAQQLLPFHRVDTLLPGFPVFQNRYLPQDYPQHRSNYP